MDINKYLDKDRKLIDRELDRYLPKGNIYPPEVHQAMRYMVMSGGKRFRPILVLEACRACGGKTGDAMPAACAIELVHTYSVIHDDLPAMDDSDTRRGKPSCHVRFGEANAILAGDALLSLAFNLVGRMKGPRAVKSVLLAVSHAVGTFGMVGGQVEDLKHKEKKVELPLLEYISTHKTGALISVSAKIGAIIAKAPEKKAKALLEYGKHIGLAFQIVDDILDKEGYAEAFGIKGARDEAKRLAEKAKKALGIFGKKAAALRCLADLVYERAH